MDMMEKYYEDTYKTNYDMDKEETFYIHGKILDYRVVKTTLDVYDEEYEKTGVESVGMGACVSIHEISENRPDILTLIENTFNDYEWEYYESVIYNTCPEIRGATSTMIYTDETDVNTLVNNVLETLEKIA